MTVKHQKRLVIQKHCASGTLIGLVDKYRSSTSFRKILILQSFRVLSCVNSKVSNLKKDLISFNWFSPDKLNLHFRHKRMIITMLSLCWLPTDPAHWIILLDPLKTNYYQPMHQWSTYTTTGHIVNVGHVLDMDMCLTSVGSYRPIEVSLVVL